MNAVDFNRRLIIRKWLPLDYFHHQKPSRYVSEVDHAEVLVVLYGLLDAHLLIGVVWELTCIDVENLVGWQAQDVHLADHHEISEVYD